MTIPCNECLTLVMCRIRAIETDSVTMLGCYMLEEWLQEGIMEDDDARRRIFVAWRYLIWYSKDSN